MFDVGFSELIVIGIVALVVIGPEKLPRVARTIGHLLGRAQRYVNDVKADINREMQLDELKKLQADVVDSARAMESSVRQDFESARLSVEAPVQEAVATVDEAVAPLQQAVTEAPAAPAEVSTPAQPPQTPAP